MFNIVVTFFILLLFSTSCADKRYFRESRFGRASRDAATRRDPQYILDMMETMLVTMDARFKTMDVVDATRRFTLENMLKTLDAIDGKMGETGHNIESLVSTMKSMDSKFNQHTSRGLNANEMDNKLETLTIKLDQLDRRMSQLSDQVSQSARSTKQQQDLLLSSSERRHIVTTPDGKLINQANTAKLENDLESVKGTLRGLDSKLQSQTDKMTSTISTLVKNIADIKEAILEPAATDTTANSTTTDESEILKPIKFERFGRKLRPLMHVAEKLDDIYTAVVNTRHSIDDTRQKSDQLLTRAYHTAQALTDVKYDLYYQTSKIIENLSQVEQWLREQTGAASSLDPKFLTSGLKQILDKVDQQDQKDRITQKLPELVDTEDQFPADTYTTTGDLSLEERVTAANPRFSNALNATTFSINASTTCPFQEHPGINCADLKSRGVNKSGVYYILIKGTTYWFMKVFCEMETAQGGWTVIQRRDEYGETHESFNRDWNEYKNGFGDLSKEFWLGNENIFMLTNQDEYTLRIDLEDFDGNKRYAEYSKFKLSSEAENYKLEIGGYDGTAGDSLNDPWYGSNLSPFSTYNRDNDRSSLNCASMLRGGWWWRSCGRGLNGIYLTDPNDLAARQGIVWFRWRGWDYNLKKAQMMIRPKEFEPEYKHRIDNVTEQSTPTTDREQLPPQTTAETTTITSDN